MRYPLATAALGLLLAASSAAADQYLAISEQVPGSGGRVELYRQNADGSLASTTPALTLSEHLSTPSGIAYNAATSDLFVSSIGSGRVLDYNLATGTESTFANLAASGHSYPFGLTILNGSLYVAATDGNPTGGEVLRYNLASGVLQATYTNSSLQAPTGLTTDGTSVYVASSANNGIFEINPTTGVVSSYLGPRFGFLSAPAGLTCAYFGGFEHFFVANFFSYYAGSEVATDIFDAVFGGTTPISTGNPSIGGAAQLVVGTGTVSVAGTTLQQVLVSDAGDGTILQFGSDQVGALHGQSTYLTLAGGAQPTYMTELSFTGTPQVSAVPEPSSLALAGAGGLALLGIARRRASRRAA